MRLVSRPILLGVSCCLLAACAPACRAGCGGSRGGEPQDDPPALLRRVTGPPGATPAHVDIDDDRPVFLVAAMRGPIQIWSETGTDPASVVPIPSASLVLAARFSGNGVFFALEPGPTTLWSWRENRSLSAHDFGRRGRQAAVSHDGRYVAFGGSVAELALNREVGDAKAIASQSALAFSANGARVVSAGFQEPWIAVRDLPGGSVREWLAPGKVSHAVLSPDGDVVAASMQDGAVHFWRQPGGEDLGSWKGEKEIRALCFEPVGTFLVVTDAHGLSVIDVASRRRTWRADVEGELWAVACDGDLIAAGTTDGAVWLWDIARRVVRGKLRLASSTVVALDVSAKRQRVAAADDNGEAAIWSWR